MADQFFGYNDRTSQHLLCGWSSDGLQVFNQLAKEVCKNRQEHGEDFDKAFKNTMEEDMASTNKAGKRKRNGIDTYNDLNASALIMKDAETGAGGEEEEEEWVSKHVFTV
jgi:hypothetical protein